MGTASHLENNLPGFRSTDKSNIATCRMKAKSPKSQLRSAAFYAALVKQHHVLRFIEDLLSRYCRGAR